MWNDFLQYILDAVFPSTCVSCQASISRARDPFLTLCSLCASTVPTLSYTSCPRCLHRLPTYKNTCHPETHFSIGAATLYQSSHIRNLIHALKYRHLKNAFVPLSFFFFQFLHSLPSLQDFFLRETIIIPVPLHPQRERERGFNQSLLFAHVAYDFFSTLFPSIVSLQPHLMHRVRATKPQSEISDHVARFSNIASCFALSSPRSIKGKNIILIDDVFTSGATIGEAVKLLHKAGARNIVALVMARAT